MMNPSRTAITIVLAYIIFAFLQAPSFSKIDPSAKPADILYFISTFTIILVPAAYFGVKADPGRIRLTSKSWHDLPAFLYSPLLPALGLAFLAFSLNAGLSVLFTKVWTAPTSQSYVLSFNLLDKIANSGSAGIWEEAVFRLFLLSSILALTRSKLVSVTVSDILFTIPHAFLQQPPYNAPALVIVFIIGLIYSFCYLRWGLESAMACHGAMDLFSMTLGPSLG